MRRITNKNQCSRLIIPYTQANISFKAHGFAMMENYVTDSADLDLTKIHPFYNFVNQVGLVSEEKDLYFISLMASLSIPDICGALGSGDGLATGPKYKAWFNQWLGNEYKINGKTILDGHDCYMLRCAVLHQGRLMHHNSTNNGAMFIKPHEGSGKLHKLIFNGYLAIDIQEFATDMTNGAIDWFESVVGSDPFEKNFANSMQIHFGGFGGIRGCPVIA